MISLEKVRLYTLTWTTSWWATIGVWFSLLIGFLNCSWSDLIVLIVSRRHITWIRSHFIVFFFYAWHASWRASIRVGLLWWRWRESWDWLMVILNWGWWWLSYDRYLFRHRQVQDDSGRLTWVM
jgi:hypothetical protein